MPSGTVFFLRRRGLRQFARQELQFSDQLPAAWREDAAGDLSVGCLVKADWGGFGTLYPGTIAAANADGTFAVRYDDGDEEMAVKRSSIERR